MSPQGHEKIDRLIVVCGHAIWLGGSSKGHEESEWLIAPFQTGETPTFVAHIKAGLEALAANPSALLVFSGADTRAEAAPLSEAVSYHNLAASNDFFGHPATVTRRIAVDEFATDSFQNVLFPLLIFGHHALGAPVNSTEPGSALLYPTHLTIISHDFKSRRFIDLHLPALHWPNTPETFAFIGINPPLDQHKARETLQGELMLGYKAWERDMYGSGKDLGEKRRRRGWMAARQETLEAIVRRTWTRSGYLDSVIGLLRWTGGEHGTELYPRGLPWAENSSS